MSRPPNVVVCLCDQLRAFEVGCYGNAVIQTPHIDRLARQGVRFETAVTNSPLCLPARSSLLSGQYARTCTGVLDNVRTMLPDGTYTTAEHPEPGRPHIPDPTLAEQLGTMGYDTAVIGKWHIYSTPRDLGFGYSLVPRVHHRQTKQVFREDGGDEFVVDGWAPDFEAQRVKAYLEAPHERPFFLFYNIAPPHPPIADAPVRYLSMYAPDSVPLRPNVYVDGELPHNEEWFKIYLYDFLYYDGQRASPAYALPEGFGLRHLTALYYGLTTWVDDLVGTLLANLTAAGLDDNTIVIFGSDHGDNLGSHGYWNKGRLMEESIRIPLVVRAPGVEPAVARQQVASIVDIMPTVLELVGAEIPSSVQGRSLAPVLQGESAELPDNHAFIETHGHDIGIRTPMHLYAMQLDEANRQVVDSRRMFYDLRSDPYQQPNLAGTATGEQATLADALQQRLEAWHRDTPWLGD